MRRSCADVTARVADEPRRRRDRTTSARDPGISRVLAREHGDVGYAGHGGHRGHDTSSRMPQRRQFRTSPERMAVSVPGVSPSQGRSEIRLPRFHAAHGRRG
jgi:hypothetical protein